MYDSRARFRHRLQGQPELAAHRTNLPKPNPDIPACQTAPDETSTSEANHARTGQ